MKNSLTLNAPPTTEALIDSVIPLWKHVGEPYVLWQIAALIISLVIGKAVQHFISKRFILKAPSTPGIPSGPNTNLLVPLSGTIAALLCTYAFSHVLNYFYTTAQLLYIALSLLLSLALIRFTVLAIWQAMGHISWIKSLTKAVAIIAWCIVALHILGWLPAVVTELDNIAFTLGTQRLSLLTLLQGSITIVIAIITALWISNILEQHLLKHKAAIDANAAVLISRITKTVLLAATILITLPMVGINLTTLSVFGGALGVGLGFGLQKITANYISGFIILLDRSLRIGSLISVGNERGIVKEITTRYTVIRAGNGIESIIPNELLIGSVVQNETFSDTKVAIALQFQVAYDTDLEQALKILIDVAAEQPRILKDPAPGAQVTSFADNGINLRLGFWIADPTEGTLGISSTINLEVWRRFKKTGISMPFPQREIRILPSAPQTQSQSLTIQEPPIPS